MYLSRRIDSETASFATVPGIALGDAAQFEAGIMAAPAVVVRWRRRGRDADSAAVTPISGRGSAELADHPPDEPVHPRMSLSERTDPAATLTLPSWSLSSPA